MLNDARFDDGKDGLLSPEEIAVVLRSAKDPMLRHPYVLNIGNARTTVQRVTPKHGLILVKGDEHTGMHHVTSRHTYPTRDAFWREESSGSGPGRIVLDDPSRFGPRTIPFFDYPQIADAVFSESNRADNKNKRPDRFELFEGEAEVNAGRRETFRLILYKGCRIIHTLFPVKKTHNLKKVVNYHKGEVRGEIDEAVPYYLIVVPYLDHLERVRYRVCVRKYYDKSKEEIYIEALDERGRIIVMHRLGERDFIKQSTWDDELYGWQYGSLENVERFIRDLDKSLWKR